VLNSDALVQSTVQWRAFEHMPKNLRVPSKQEISLPPEYILSSFQKHLVPWNYILLYCYVSLRAFI
jgi:hypothetical protein